MTQTLSPADAVGFLIARAKQCGADAAEACGVNSISVSAGCRFGKTESLEQSQTAAVDLRVFAGRRQAAVASSVLDTETLSVLAERAVEMAKAVPEDPYCGPADPSEQAKTFDDLDLCDPVDRSTDELLTAALKAEDAALSVAGVSNSDGAEAAFERSFITIASTTGFERKKEISSCGFSVSVVAGTDEKETDYDYSSAVYFSDLDAPETIGKNAADRAVRRLGAKKIASETMDVVFEPRLARGLIGTIAGAINGAAIARGTSFLKDALNTAILPETLSVIERPFLTRGLASRTCDAEGIPSTERALVDHGVLTTWLLDLRSARQLGFKPTGHAVRGLGGTPRPAPSNLILEGGEATPDELIADIRRGLYVTNLFGQGVDLITGDYSRGAAGFLIENGRLTTPVSEVTVAGNLREMFKTMTAANDLSARRYAINAPTLRMANMSVAGK